jgi:predicted porin
MAVAVAGALAAPGLALAQAANVQIYGALDMRFDSMKFTSDTAGTQASTTKQHVYGTANRWGLRGTESLGGGLAAFFQVESGMAVDGRPTNGLDTSGVNVLGGRDSYLGLSSTTWGAVQAGTFSTPYKAAGQVWSVIPTLGHGGIIMGGPDTTGALPTPNCGGIVSPAGALTAAAAAGTTCASNGIEGNATSFFRRQSDQIQYTSPTFAGIVLRVAMALDEYEINGNAPNGTVVANAGHKSKLGSYSATWSGGPFSAVAAYQEHRGFQAVAGGPQNAKDYAWTFGGRWNYGAGLLGGAIERFKYANASATAATNDFALTNWVINGTFNVGPSGVISAGYSRSQGRKDCGTGLTSAANTCGDPTRANIVSLAYDHRLSKRTGVYAAAGRINNGAGTNYYYIAGPTSNSNGGDTGGVAAGVDVTTYAVGVKHTF